MVSNAIRKTAFTCGNLPRIFGVTILNVDNNVELKKICIHEINVFDSRMFSTLLIGPASCFLASSVIGITFAIHRSVLTYLGWIG
jgi:hypothetical protein